MQYDVVIIGGGAAGAVVASRLAAHPHLSVLLLEAGPDYPDPAHLPDDGFVANFAQEVMQGQWPLSVEEIRQPGSRTIRS